MQIEVECIECHARYRVGSDVVGRVVECNHCHRKFRVPYQSRVAHLEEVDLAPSDAETQPRTYQEYGPKAERLRNRLKPASGAEQPFVRLSPLVCELWLPLLVALISYGVSIWIAIHTAMSCASPRSGWTMLAALAGMYVLAVLAVVNRVAEAAAATLDIKLTDSIWLQNVAASALPVLGVCIGLLLGGERPLPAIVCGGLVGGILILPYMLFVHQASPQKTVQFAAMLFLASVIGSAAAGALVTGALALALPGCGMPMPWEAPDI